uniref:Transposase Tc1-like domain-containing protein n=1 Tax=Rhizophagus irregularis (strain DAOM 181602 / DAOM 197198 / MUCL 43194) TaxID=747089 RepID=U9TIM9_RHIID
MVKTRELSDFERGRVIGFYEAGDSERTISEKTGYGAFSIASRSGRPKKLTERDKRHLKVIVTQNRREPVEKIVKNFAESTGKVICKNTMKNTLYNMGYHSCTALRKPNVSERNRKIRLKWARERRELEALLQECWSEIPCEVYQKLVESMVRRIEEEKYRFFIKNFNIIKSI